MSLFASAQGISGNLMRRKNLPRTAKLGRGGTFLVDNAGHGFHGKWWELPIEKDLSMIDSISGAF
jgi:hypothetical protein